MIPPPMLDQMIKPREPTITSALASWPWTVVENGAMDGLVVAAEICATAEGRPMAVLIVARRVVAVEAFAVVVVAVVGSGPSLSLSV